ncbi:MAG TPA: GFA family protein [Steroidobacteraceae bacterium]
MTTMSVRCDCGGVEAQLTGEPMAQYVCHCRDCQAVHGRAYSVALYPTCAVTVTRGDTAVFALKTTPRTRCSRCGTYLFAEVPGYPFRGVNGDLLPQGRFNPEFHVHCRYAATRIDDELPHYKDTPVKFRGSGETMAW